MFGYQGLFVVNYGRAWTSEQMTGPVIQRPVHLAVTGPNYMYVNTLNTANSQLSSVSRSDVNKP